MLVHLCDSRVWTFFKDTLNKTLILEKYWF